MKGLSRREFLKRSAAAVASGTVVLTGVNKPAKAAQSKSKAKAMFFDLSKCDGCQGEPIPRCVEACRVKNRDRYPEPIEDIGDYWPMKKHEDWSDKRDLISRLTPYNWMFVQQVEVEYNGKKHTVSIPRKCMHCDNPPCANVCPFGVQEKTPEGPVIIDPNYCLGGAKCRTVCPWNIPQRQAGVGIYLKLAPKFAGGGVMYKCDMCYDLIKQGKSPACVDRCPQGAITFGPREEMKTLAYRRKEEINGDIYGDTQNGGTSTFYVSPVPFKLISKSLKENKMQPGMDSNVENFLDTPNGMASAFLLAPVAGAFAAGIAAHKKLKGEE